MRVAGTGRRVDRGTRALAAAAQAGGLLSPTAVIGQQVALLFERELDLRIAENPHQLGRCVVAGQRHERSGLPCEAQLAGNAAGPDECRRYDVGPALPAAATAAFGRVSWFLQVSLASCIQYG